MAAPARPSGAVVGKPFEVLRVTTSPLGDDLVVLSAGGRIDLSSMWLLGNELARQEHVPHLLIDLSEVDFCSVSGALLLRAALERSLVTGQLVEVTYSAAVTAVLDANGLATRV
jgi:anti-anti-sigma regulatory factor